MNTTVSQQEQIREAIQKFQETVGEAHVRTRSEDVARFSRDVSPWTRTCSVVVFPGCVEEIQAILQIAREHNLSVWPFSKAKNWGYGAAVALQENAVVMVLERMNRILEVNEESAYVVVEPGVTQRQLNDHLKTHHPGLWADCTDSTPEGSVLGNALERGVGYTSYGDHFGNLCGLEVVLPDGTVIRTGGGPANALAWNTYKWGTGPYLEGLFSQSNLGIVVKGGIWLMPAPEAFRCFVFNLNSDGDREAVFDAIRRLALNRAIQSNVHMVNDYLFMTLLDPKLKDRYAGSSRLPDATLAQLCQQHRVTPWTLTGGLYGSHAQVRANQEMIRKELSPFGRLTFLDDKRIESLERLTRWLKVMEGKPILAGLGRLLRAALAGSVSTAVLEIFPSVYPIFKGIPGDFIVRRCEYVKSHTKAAENQEVDPVRADDAGGLIWFAPVIPLTREHTSKIIEMGRAACLKHGFDFSMSFILLNPRSIVALMSIFYDRKNPTESAQALDLYRSLTETALRAGYQEYRTSIANMSRLNDADSVYRQLLNTLKSSLDPDNILAPGRYGAESRNG